MTGQLAVTVDHVTSMTTQSTHPHDGYLSNIRSLQQRAANVSGLAQSALRMADDHYYDQMKALVLRPWRFAKEFGFATVDPDLRWPVDRDKANTGDCWFELFLLLFAVYCFYIDITC